MLGDDSKRSLDGTVGDPVGHPDPAAGLADAQQLGRGLLLVGREHRAEDRGDDVELAVAEGEVRGVALDELDVEPLGRCALAAALEQGRDEVDAHHVAPRAPRRRDRAVAAAAGDVENPLARNDVQRFDQFLGDHHHEPGDHREVALRPGLLLRLLDRLQDPPRRSSSLLLSRAVASIYR